MNTGKKYSKMLFLVALLVAFVAGCGSDNNAAPLSSAKAITAFVLNAATGVIDETEKTIAVNLPNGTSKVGLVATFSTTGASVKVGTTLQTNGITANDFSGTVLYTVIAADGTSVNYAVTVTVGLPTSNTILTYSLAGQVSSSITGTAIAVTMPFGTNKVGLIATFSHSGASVMVGSTTQVSGVTPNNFTSPVPYTVTAANSDIKTYMVTVTNALNSAKDITSYTIASQVSSTIIASSITVTMPYSTPSVTNLVATFSTNGAFVTVGTTTQVSGTTPNNFSSPSGVVYTVHAANGTTKTYTVIVHVSTTAPLAVVDLLTAGDFVIFSDTAIANPGAAGTITGDIGTGPGVTSTAITGFALVLDGSGVFSTSSLVTGSVYAFDYTPPTPTKVTTASTDMLTAYNDAAGRALPDFTELYTGDLSGQTLVPGLYKWSNTVLINTDVTLAGSATDVWIFQIAGDLTVAAGGSVPAGIKVLLTGGALAKNVFWQVGGGTGATLGTYSTFEGIILSAKQIVMNTGAVLNGRALAQTQVSMDANAVTQPAP